MNIDHRDRRIEGLGKLRRNLIEDILTCFIQRMRVDVLLTGGARLQG